MPVSMSPMQRSWLEVTRKTHGHQRCFSRLDSKWLFQIIFVSFTPKLFGKKHSHFDLLIFFQFGWGSKEITSKFQWDFRKKCKNNIYIYKYIHIRNRVGIGSSKTFPLRANCHYFAWFVLLHLPPPFKQNWGFQKRANINMKYTGNKT